MDNADIQSLNHDASLQDDAFITVSRQAYEAMDEELQRYRALYGALPAEITSVKQDSQAAQLQQVNQPADTLPESFISHPSQSDAILSILNQDDSALKGENLEDMEASLLSMSANEVIRHYGFKRMKMNHR